MLLVAGLAQGIAAGGLYLTVDFSLTVTQFLSSLATEYHQLLAQDLHRP